MANVSGFDPAAFFIGGGAEHSPEVVRNAVFSMSGGAEGVTNPGDWKVEPLEVPGTQVRVRPGSGLILNRHIGDDPDETYSARAGDESFLDVRETGSSGGRSDLVVVRVEDPQYEGHGWAVPPSEEAARTWDYTKPVIIENVPPSTTKAEQLNLGYAAYGVARIDMGANRGTVDNSEGARIVDLRKLHSPKRSLDVFRHQPSAEYDIPTDIWGHWPAWEPLFEIPTWATHITAVMTATGAWKAGGAHILGDLNLELNVPGVGGTNILGSSTFEVEANDWPSRETLMVSGEGEIPASYRGQVRTIRIGARRDSVRSGGTPAQGSLLRATATTNFTLLVEFEQRAA